jgi:hypothetical protein
MRNRSPAKIAGLVAAGARAYLEKDVGVVARIARNQQAGQRVGLDVDARSISVSSSAASVRSSGSGPPAISSAALRSPRGGETPGSAS